MATSQNLLLIEDVEGLGRKGQVVKAKSGYARNFLLPQGLALMADKNALRMQERLVEERQKQAIVDKQKAEEKSERMNGVTLMKIVKVDHEGHMYGSVTVSDIIHLVNEEIKIELQKKNVHLKHPIKETGVHTIPVKLEEGVLASFTLKVISEEEARKQ